MKRWGGPWAVLLTAFLGGCSVAPPLLPTTVWYDVEEARQVLIERRESIANVQAQCSLIIMPADKSRSQQNLDGALVFDRRGNARLRTYKLGQVVFDLTLNSDGAWVAVSKELKDDADEARRGLGQLADALPGLLRGPDFRDAQLVGTPPAGDLRAAWPDVQAVVDGRTLAPVRYTFTGEAAESVHRLETRYTTYGDAVWLHELTAEGSFGKITLTLRNVELNGELNPRAFKPPRRAVKVETGDGADAS
ncbi:MAG: hypothetical protein AAF333_13860 [Planctomycetota bacterium]